MCGVGEMVLVVECEHVGGTTSAPYTTTTTQAEAKAQCDLSSFFHGYPVTATNMHLSIQANGVKHSQKVTRDPSQHCVHGLHCAGRWIVTRGCAPLLIWRVW